MRLPGWFPGGHHIRFQSSSELKGGYTPTCRSPPGEISKESHVEEDRFLSSEEYDEKAHRLYSDGDYEGALEMLREGLSLYPNAVELYVGLGYARLAREEFAWARRSFHQALSLDSTHEDALVGMGEVLLRLGDHAKALAYFV